MPNIAADSVIHVVAGLIRHRKKKHKLFFTRRKPGQHLENLWEIPGGKREPGESRFHALKRELQEEVGIEVIAAQPLHAVTHHYEDKSVHLDVWEIEAYRGKPRGCEAQQSEWIKISDLSGYPFPEADAPVLRALSLPPSLLITPELSAIPEAEVLAHFSRLMKKRRYSRVLFRSHQMNDKGYHELARKLQDIMRLNGGELIIHRPELNSLKQKRFFSFKHRHLSAQNLAKIRLTDFPQDTVLTASCHNQAEIEQARQLGCEFAVLSCVRPTASHPQQNPIGWFEFSRMCQQSRLPLYALGGVARKDLCTARYQGAVGVAGIRDFWAL